MTNHTLLLAQANLSGLGTVAMVAAGLVIVVVLFAAIWASRYIKVGPNEVLVVSGRPHRFPGGANAHRRRPGQPRQWQGPRVDPIRARGTALQCDALPRTQQPEDSRWIRGCVVRRKVPRAVGQRSVRQLHSHLLPGRHHPYRRA